MHDDQPADAAGSTAEPAAGSPGPKAGSRDGNLGLDPLQYLPIAAYVDEIDGVGAVRLVYSSPRYEELCGIEPANLADDALPWDDRVHPDDRSAYLQSFERLWRDLHEQDIEYRFRRRDDEWVWLHDRAAAVRDAARGVTVVNGVLTDVTRRREAEETASRALAQLEEAVEVRTEQLRQSLAELESTRENLANAQGLSHVGSFEWAATGATRMSAEFCHICGVEPDTGLGLYDLRALIHPDDRQRLDADLSSALRGTPPDVIDYRIVRSDGDIRIVELRAQVERDDTGAVVRVHGSAQDITERRLADDEIRRLNAELAERVHLRTEQRDAAARELEAFAYSIAHDVRAPLRAIDGFSAMVSEDAADRLTEVDLDHLTKVREAAQRMAGLIDDLLGLSRVSRYDMRREHCDLSLLAIEIADELRAEAPERSISVSVRPGLAADADAPLLRLILRELLDNAWKFTRPRQEAHIEIGAQDADGERAFYVRDDGIGFDLRYAEHLFGAFQRMHGGREFEGDGIGLATVQRLVRRHGGRAWAESEVDKGTTVYFTLPPADGAGAATTTGD